jgi:hypothetical protein
LGLFLLNIITRLSGYLTASIWYDEAISLYRAALPLSRQFTDGSEFQGMNLYEVILRPFAAGPLWLLRLPALLFSIGSVYLAWLIMRRLNFTSTRINIALIGLATLPGILWMSQDARYYTFLAFFFLLALWGGLAGKPWILVINCMILILTHPTGAAWAAGAIVASLLAGLRLRALIWMSPLIIVAGIYKLTTLVNQEQLTTFWLQNTDPVFLTLQTLLAFWADTLDGWGAILGLATIAGICLPVINLATDRTLRTVYMAVAVPILIMLLVGMVYQPVLFYRTMQPGLPMFCILAGYVLAPSRKWYTWILPAVAALTVIMALANWNPSSRGGNIEGAAQFIERGWQEGDAIYYGTGTVAMPFDYYVSHQGYLLDGKLNRNISWPGIPFQQIPLEQIQASRVWLIYPLEFTLDPADAARLETYASGGTLVYRIDAIHFAPILVYLVER